MKLATRTVPHGSDGIWLDHAVGVPHDSFTAFQLRCENDALRKRNAELLQHAKDCTVFGWLAFIAFFLVQLVLAVTK
jgi:hypothetical protein